MKIRTKLTTLFLCFAMQSSGLVYAQQNSYDIMDLIPWGAVVSGRNKFSLEICKVTPTWLPINCGDGKGGHVDNFYVIYIEKTETPAKSSPHIKLEDGSIWRTEIPNDFCKSDSIEHTIVGLGDLPANMQEEVRADERFKTKQAVYHRFRVHNGNGKDTIRLRQLCIIENPI